MEKEENVTMMCHSSHRSLVILLSALWNSNYPVEFVWESLQNMLDKLWLSVLFNKTH